MQGSGRSTERRKRTVSSAIPSSKALGRRGGSPEQRHIKSYNEDIRNLICSLICTTAAFAASGLDEARAHRLAGRYDQAATLYRTALKEDRNNAAAWEGLVRSLLSNEKGSEALAAAD